MIPHRSKLSISSVCVIRCSCLRYYIYGRGEVGGTKSWLVYKGLGGRVADYLMLGILCLVVLYLGAQNTFDSNNVVLFFYAK